METHYSQEKKKQLINADIADLQKMEEVAPT